ncbi:MAG TPA: zf-HC2 domain-containing protein [Pyrinomonadaceae bacterium]|jgi:Putative zinc-finger
MTELNCESVSMAAMAITDGNQPELSAEQVEAHLASCADCRRELGQLQELSSLLNSQERRLRTENLWGRIEPRLVGARSTRISAVLPSFIFLGALLLGYRLVELIPDRDFSFLFKFVPVLLVIAAFGYLRENPFKINSELSLEGES